MPVRFARNDEKRVPEHWKTFGQRSSTLSFGPRSAINPANAILNYLYAMLEAETRIACSIVGLDPGLGFFHTDTRGRDSLALDLMEVARPFVDAFVLELLASRAFRASDFTETRKGVCRISPSVTHLLAGTAPTWATAIAPAAETLVAMLADDSGATTWGSKTPLTQTRRRSAQGRTFKPMVVAAAAREFAGTCQVCGAGIPDPDKVHCDSCQADYEPRRAEQYTAAGLAALAR